jgi:hypothetical protein
MVRVFIRVYNVDISTCQLEFTLAPGLPSKVQGKSALGMELGAKRSREIVIVVGEET